MKTLLTFHPETAENQYFLREKTFVSPEISKKQSYNLAEKIIQIKLETAKS